MSSLLIEMIPITFAISYLGKDFPVRTYQNQYFSLMSLIVDNLQVQGLGCLPLWEVVGLSVFIMKRVDLKEPRCFTR